MQLLAENEKYQVFKKSKFVLILKSRKEGELTGKFNMKKEATKKDAESLLKFFTKN